MGGWPTKTKPAPKTPVSVSEKDTQKLTSMMSAETNNNDIVTSFDVMETPAATSLSPLNKVWIMLTPKVLKVIIIALTSAVIIGTAIIVAIVVTNVVLTASQAPLNGTAALPSPSSSPPTVTPGLSSTTSSSSSSSSTSSATTTPSSTTSTTTESTTSSTTESTTSSTTESTTSTTESTTSTTESTTSTTTESTTTPTTTTTTTTLATTTTVQECADNEFLCGSGECIAFSKMCDGLPHCQDGSDEGVDCVCGVDQWQCTSGQQCIPATARCDQVTDCRDSSDEMQCPDCSGFECDTGLCLWDGYYGRCNGVFDCTDLSDEIGCPVRAGMRRCDNRVAIPRNQWCNGVDNCGDNSDETNCQVCRGTRVACPDGRCILRQWRCDGYADCENGTDEIGCGDCKATQFMCDNYQCIELSSVCDGQRDCDTGEDELHCFSAQDVNQGLLWARYQGQNYAVCSEHWTTDYAVQICSDIDQLQLASWDKVTPPPSVTEFVAFTNDTLSAQTTNLARKSSCESGKVISISCHTQECGERKVAFSQSFVAGGQIVAPGKWPWMVSLLHLGHTICGGTLINNSWVLTAAHCILKAAKGNYNFTATPFYFDVIVGSTHRLGQSRVGTPYRIRVSQIVLHPNLTQFLYGGMDWDIALVKLAVPVSFTDYIQPICLPHQGQTVPLTSLCYVAGWGLMNSQQGLAPEYLRDTRMQVWSDRRCSRSTVSGSKTVNINSTLCGGYTFDGPEACQGDSGGPLMCLSTSSRWMLTGIVIRGSTPCGIYEPRKQANHFARVAGAADWIRQYTAQT